jgi:hypothetical protein
MSGPEDGLFNWNFSEHGYDRRIMVVLHSSGIESAPTIDVIDDGIGIRPGEFPSTILSLQSGNKIKKWYLIGAFGQGGASTLAFCDYAFILSRHRDDPNVVGFTLIRVLNLNETYKEDTYAYLCLRDSGGNISVPSCQVGGAALEILKSRDGFKQHGLTTGQETADNKHACFPGVETFIHIRIHIRSKSAILPLADAFRLTFPAVQLGSGRV